MLLQQTRNLDLNDDEKKLLIDVLLSQNYMTELVSSELSDIESGLKDSNEERVRKLNDLLLRLHKSGV